MTAGPLELAGIVIACAAAGYAVAGGDPRWRLAASVVALLVAPLIVLGSVWDEPRVVELRESPATIAAGLAVGVLALAGCVVAFRRWSVAFPVAAIALLPLRVPIEIGGETANLLVPLYVAIAAGAIVRGLELRAGSIDTGAGREGGVLRAVRLLLAMTLVLYAVQSAYSEDVSNAIETAGFFLVPFAVMFALLSERSWNRRTLGFVLAAGGGIAVVCALVGIGQYLVRDLFLNPELLDANQLHQYFRVNSLFFDPNILGRYLALALSALGAYLAWDGDRRGLALALVACAISLTALAFSFSITSHAALLAGLGLVAVLRWRWRGAIGAAALGGAALVALLIAGGTPSSDIESDRYFDSGRESLLEGGIDLFEERPLAGWGSGGFGRAFFEQIESARTTVSHSEPVTVAAEQGVIGLIPYVALVAVTLLALVAGAGGSRGRAAVAACYVAMIVHSLGYAGFLTDPATWALLALGVALARAAATESARGGAVAASRAAVPEPIAPPPATA